MAGQMEMPFPRAVGPRVRAAKAEKNALRRQRQRRKRMGVFTTIDETTPAAGGLRPHSPQNRKEKIMQKISEAFGSRYLTGRDLPQDGTPVFVYIHDVKEEVVGWDKENKPVLYFAAAKGKPALKPYILGNATNAHKLAAEYGDDPAAWPGKPVKVWAVDTEYKGETTKGVRMAPAKSAAQPAMTSAAPDLDDEIPF
jgi:hypothetical protein